MELQMNKTFIYLAMSSCFIFGTTIAHADSESSQGKMPDKMFKSMDANSDGRVTRDEFNDYGAKKFREMDTNGSGDVTSDEMKAGYKGMNEGDGRNSGGTAGVRANTSRGHSTSPRGDIHAEEGQYLGSGSSGGQDGGADSTDGPAASSESRREAARAASAERSGGSSVNMNDTWDQNRDDAWHQNRDSSWDKKRDDAWHKKNNNTRGGATSPSSQF
jgi:hypothetical protein